MDPDLHKDIVTLGFVKNLDIDAGKVRFTVELTTPACPVKDQLKKECEDKVAALPGVVSVDVTMTAAVRGAAPEANRLSIPGVRNLIAIASGKGGVGKSTVTVNLALALAKTGARVGLLDADVYGPSLPLMMGTRDARPQSDASNRIYPVEKYDLKLMSMGYLVPEDKPVVWRGPMVHGALTQFLTQVAWGELDYLLVDMPPGTGDAQLTMSQTAPLSGAIIVTTPQEVSLIDARKGLKMFQSVQVPVLGIVENMAGFVCGHCDQVTSVFRTGGGEKLAKESGVPLLGSLPLDPTIAEAGDAGVPLVVSHPESTVATLYSRLAGQVAARLSQYQLGGGQAFEPVSLDWK